MTAQRFAAWWGELIPVTHLFDADGEEVADIADATSFVAGPLRCGGWLSGLVSEHPEIQLVRPLH